MEKPASRLKEGAKRRNAPTTQRRIQLPVVAGRTSPPRHVPKVHGAQKERRMSEPAGTQTWRRMGEALVQPDKQFEWAIYPDKNHGIYGGNTRLHLYKKMTNFLSKTLGDKISSKQN